MPKKKVGPAASPGWGRAERRTGSRLPAGTGACPRLPDAVASTGARKPERRIAGGTPGWALSGQCPGEPPSPVPADERDSPPSGQEPAGRLCRLFSLPASQARGWMSLYTLSVDQNRKQQVSSQMNNGTVNTVKQSPAQLNQPQLPSTCHQKQEL